MGVAGQLSVRVRAPRRKQHHLPELFQLRDALVQTAPLVEPSPQRHVGADRRERRRPAAEIHLHARRSGGDAIDGKHLGVQPRTLGRRPEVIRQEVVAGELQAFELRDPGDGAGDEGQGGLSGLSGFENGEEVGFEHGARRAKVKGNE